MPARWVRLDRYVHVHACTSTSIRGTVAVLVSRGTGQVMEYKNWPKAVFARMEPRRGS